MTQSFDLLQKVEKATRVTANTATLIYHIYVSNKLDDLLVQEVSIPEISLSDHFPVVITVGFTKLHKNGSHKSIKYRSNYGGTEHQVLNDVKNKLINLKFSLTNNLNCGDTFNSILSEMYNKYYPMIEKRVKNKPRIPWINKVILNAMRMRDKYKSLGRFNKYKRWRNRVVNLIRSNKKSHFQHIIQKAKGNSQIFGYI